MYMNVSLYINDMKNKKYHSRQFQNPIEKSYKRGKFDIINILIIHDLPLSQLGIDTTIKSGEVKLVLCAQTSPFSEMMRSYKCFPLNLDISLHYVAYLILIAVMRFSFHHCNYILYKNHKTEASEIINNNFAIQCLFSLDLSLH